MGRTLSQLTAEEDSALGTSKRPSIASQETDQDTDHFDAVHTTTIFSNLQLVNHSSIIDFAISEDNSLDLDEIHVDQFDAVSEMDALRGQSCRALEDTKPHRPSRRSTMPSIPFYHRPGIVLFGDSLTQYAYGDDTMVGWASLLSHSYQRRADIYNRGFAGYNTRFARPLLGKLFGKMDSSVLFTIIWFGANDASVPGDPQHVPLSEYEENLQIMIRSFRTSLKPTGRDFPILLLTPPPIHEDMLCRAFGIPLANRLNDLARQYGERVKAVASADDKCAVVDTWELLEGETEWRGKYLSDGLHLNGEGNKRVHQGIMDTIRRLFPKVAPMDDGEGKYGESGIPMEERLWQELISD